MALDSDLTAKKILERLGESDVEFGTRDRIRHSFSEYREGGGRSP